jgi:hypothetical protein
VSEVACDSKDRYTTGLKVVIATNVGVVVLNMAGSLEATAVGLNDVDVLSLMETSELVELVDPNVAAVLKAVDNMVDKTSDDDRVNTMMISVLLDSSDPAEV